MGGEVFNKEQGSAPPWLTSSTWREPHGVLTRQDFQLALMGMQVLLGSPSLGRPLVDMQNLTEEEE